MWAHAEYIKLLRSAADSVVFDLIPDVADRYLAQRSRQNLEVWKHNRQVQSISAGAVLRVQASDPFMLHWSTDGWNTPVDTFAQATAIGIHFIDIATAVGDRAPVLFTFRWLDDRWEGRDYMVEVRAG